MTEQKSKYDPDKEELNETVSEHLKRWKSWAENSDKVGDSSVSNYYSSIRRFYRKSGIEQPIDPDNMVESVADEDEENSVSMERVSNHLTTDITSRSMKYGVKKYLVFLDADAASIQGRTKVNFLKSTLDRLEFEDNTTDKDEVGKKVVPFKRVRTICEEAEEKEDELGLLTKMMYETGTRASGMKLLLWKDVLRKTFRGEKLGKNDVFISSNRSKSKSDRIVNISDSTLSRLKQIYDERDPDPLDRVFYPDLKRDSVYRKVWRFFDREEWGETPHYFRHSRLTHLTVSMYEEDDKPLGEVKEEVKDYAGHEQMETTEIYIELAEEKIKAKERTMSNKRDVEW